MRDEHRPKQELIHEVTGLRKQVVDLKEAMTARRRVEDALARPPRRCCAPSPTTRRSVSVCSAGTAPSSQPTVRSPECWATTHPPSCSGWAGSSACSPAGGAVPCSAVPSSEDSGSSRPFPHKDGVGTPTLCSRHEAAEQHDRRSLVVFEQLSQATRSHLRTRNLSARSFRSPPA